MPRVCVNQKRRKENEDWHGSSLRLGGKNKKNLSQRRKAAKRNTPDFGNGYTTLRSLRLCVSQKESLAEALRARRERRLTQDFVAARERRMSREGAKPQRRKDLTSALSAGLRVNQNELLTEALGRFGEKVLEGRAKKTKTWKAVFRVLRACVRFRSVILKNSLLWYALLH
jgi:hypothetical protein